MATSVFSHDELEVASILLEVPSLFLLQNLPLRFDQVTWGAKRRRTEPPYRVVPNNPTEPVEKKEQTASPSTPLSFPNSCGEDPTVAPPSLKQRVKKQKPTRHKEWVKEKKEMVAALSEKNSDLMREIGVVKEKFQRLQAFNSFLRDQKPKLQQNEEIILHQILPSSNNPPFVTTWTPPQPVQLRIEQQQQRRTVFNFDLNESPSEDAPAMTWMAEEPTKTAKEMRRERLEKQREKYRGRVSKSASCQSTAQKRPRVR